MFFIYPSTVYSHGKIIGTIVSCTEDEYNSYMQDYDRINENTVSATFLREYLESNGIDLKDFVQKHSKNAPAGRVGIWLYAYVITIPDVKEIIELARLDYYLFLDKYCEYLKTL